MAKIFYVSEKNRGRVYTQINFFKTEKEALEYGISEWPDFDMFGDPDSEEDSYDADNDTWWEGESIDLRGDGLLMSWEEDRVYLQSADDEEARKFVRSSKHWKRGSAIFFDSFKKGMYGILGNRTIEGKGFKWEWDGNKINEKTQIKTQIKNKIKSKMKHVKLFEEFTGSLNEKFSKKDAKQLIKDLKADGYDASGDENWIQVDGVDSPNPDYDGTVSMAWDPSEEEAYSDDDTYEDPVTTAEDFTDLVFYPEDTFGKWD